MTDVATHELSGFTLVLISQWTAKIEELWKNMHTDCYHFSNALSSKCRPTKGLRTKFVRARLNSQFHFSPTPFNIDLTTRHFTEVCITYRLNDHIIHNQWPVSTIPLWRYATTIYIPFHTAIDTQIVSILCQGENVGEAYSWTLNTLLGVHSWVDIRTNI